ncbi:unnamed protein product [Brachionus calyciflorus]|uniref:Nuclear pore complex protein n=1 Tax=Brachionus calyciflorus TaxID=104777 RepID=A0A814ENN3_9BILA|nr:unnamed protein product [Brachionus calyciflorus]
MESFMGSYSNRTNSFFDDQNDSLANISTAMNRSKFLLNEMASNTHTSKASTGLLKTSLLQSKSMLSHSMVQENIEEPKDQQSSIYTQFKIDTNKNIDEDSNLSELLKSYSEICTEQSHFIKEKLQHINANRNRDLYNTISNEYESMEKEKNLWNLIYQMFIDEQETKQHDNDIEADMDIENFEGLSEDALVKNLEKRNPFVRRVKLVIDWLEKNAAQSNYMKSIKDNMSSFAEKCANWEHTLHHLKSSSTFGRKDKISLSGREYVDELDPDAPIRQSKPLHDLDQEDEYKLMEYIFAFIRAGDLNSARDFCLKIGQPWRAATLEGFKLFNDRNYAVNGDFRIQQQHQIYKNEGNLNRDIWRLMVYKLIKDEKFGPYEKAVYAALAGFVTPVIPICKNYTDYVWIYFKALYNQIIEREIRQRIINREFLNDPDDENLFIISGKSSELCSIQIITHIFDRIRILINNSTNIISDNVNNSMKLMDYLKNLILSEQQSGLVLRFSSHLALFYRAASYQIKNDTLIQILDSFSQYLIDNNYKEIIAYYVSNLTPELQVKRYSKFLQTITDNKERMTMLKLAKERNMNVQAITQNIVDNLSKQATVRKDVTQRFDETSLSTTAFISKTADLFAPKTGQILTEEDKIKINAIDWIVYDQSQRLKLLEYANLTMRYFLLERQFFEATKLVFSKIPHDTITVILTHYNYIQQVSTSTIDSNFELIIENLPRHVTNLIKEYLCFKEYIESINLYNDWFDYFHKEKPIKPVSKYESETTHYEQSFAEKMTLDFEMKQYEDLSSRWYSKALLYSEKVKAKFFAVLKFPFGGWMCDVKKIEDLIEQDSESDEETNMEEETMNTEESEMRQVSVSNKKLEIRRRKAQMEELRKIYLPNICFVLLDVLSKMNLNKDLIRLSDLVASENFKLYTLFDNQQLRCLLNKLADSSINLLDSNKDYLGYD